MRRHRFDPFSLLFGAGFAGVGLAYLLGSTIADTRRVVWPIVALVVGGTIVAWGVATILRERQADADRFEHVGEPDAQDEPDATA